ncbi:MAG: sulfurtransferase [Candidatus Tectomicrobia bacterium]|uniref:Sulfurtransferase n=1 Tax=Tectimicrobiota bacterium TaxID=2528274 RepID=A0A932GR52_UNCTE|nr:sulfurtransferase [Candidatus Tectomicrobia bacterium]
MENPKGYINSDYLVTSDWLNEHRQDAGLLIIDARPRTDYESEHIPGALHHDPFPHHVYDTSPQAIFGFQKQMEEIFCGLGLQPQHTVVFYDEISGMRAPRCLWILEYLGHSQVKILDGGLAAWKAQGFPVSQEIPAPGMGSFNPNPRESLLATYQDILDRLHQPGVVLLDTRRESEYRGTEVRSARGGTIPGSIHLEWTRNLNGDGTIKNAAELRQLYEAHHVTPDKEILVYCHGGYRSANTYLALKLLGYPRVRNYLGSWGEWGNRPDLPIEIP